MADGFNASRRELEILDLRKELATEKEESASYHKFWIEARDGAKQYEQAIHRKNAEIADLRSQVERMRMALEHARNKVEFIVSVEGVGDNDLIKEIDAALASHPSVTGAGDPAKAGVGLALASRGNDPTAPTHSLSSTESNVEDAK